MSSTYTQNFILNFTNPFLNTRPFFSHSVVCTQMLCHTLTLVNPQQIILNLYARFSILISAVWTPLSSAKIINSSLISSIKGKFNIACLIRQDRKCHPCIPLIIKWYTNIIGIVGNDIIQASIISEVNTHWLSWWK